MNGNCPSGSFSYTIVAGDTLYSLAIRYNTTVQQIVALNPNINPNALRIGQVICIPGQGPTPPCNGTHYTIRQGDTFYSIARRYNVSVNALIAANPGVNPNALRIGQVICIPGAGPGQCPAGSFAYTIRQGDTLYALANRYNTTVNAIIALNPGLNPNALRIGQVICIPGAGPGPGPGPGRCPAGSFAYTIRQGDTLYALANRYNTTVNAIIALNPGINPNALRIGQVICIPGAGPGPGPGPGCPPNTFSYTVRAGDNFYQLAIRYNTSVAAIQAANPGVDPNRLQIGQRICIPR